AGRWIGHKAAVQNLADVAAMGARPVALVAALSAPVSTPASSFEQLTIGLAHRAEADGARIVGGDLGRAQQLTVTVTGVGALEGIQDPAAADLVVWHNAPDPQLSLGWTAGRSAHAMMDLSDGLIRDGGRLAAAS